MEETGCARCGAPVRGSSPAATAVPGPTAVPAADPLTAPAAAFWACDRHGVVEPLHAARWPSTEAAQELASAVPLPIWLPWPLPPGWLVSGLTFAGASAATARATVLACSGPSPVGGLGELLIVAEEPSVGLGSAYAGLAEVDPGSTFDGTAAQAKVEIGQHPTSLWCLDSPFDRAVYVGEAAGRWLWVVLHPASTGYLLAERLALVDLRDLGAEIEMLPFGALSPKLQLDAGPPAAR